MFKKILPWLLLVLAGLFGTIIGFFSRQPKINNLKGQIRKLQDNIETLQNECKKYNSNFKELSIELKALKAYQFNKKVEIQGKMETTLIMQYALKEYVFLLKKRVNDLSKLDNDEKSFFKAYDILVSGNHPSKKDMELIKQYICKKYNTEIKSMKECNLESTIRTIETLL